MPGSDGFRLRVTSRGSGSLQPRTERLLGRMVSPLCGLVKSISFMKPHQQGPRLVIAGGELTGIHVLRGQPEPRRGSYHIGGSGLFLDEAVIRTLGESCERYSQLASAIHLRRKLRFCSHDDLVAAGEAVVEPEKLRFSSEAQFERPGFPFEPFDPGAKMGWIQMASLLRDERTWVPAQLVLLGYAPKHDVKEEPWLQPAVTTGTAAHTDRAMGLRSALLELIQLDSAMGHWYGAGEAPEIVLGARCANIARLVRAQFPASHEPPRFYWLPNADLRGMTVACMLREPQRIPRLAIGLGSDTRLAPALYKALLEACGVLQLAKIAMVEESLRQGGGELVIDQGSIADLDLNVVHYALPGNDQLIAQKFGAGGQVRDGELPPDSTRDTAGELYELADSFRSSGKQLFALDLTTPDLTQLGFTSSRVWSPDTLSLPLPSFPPLAHPRFGAYGGAQHDRAHPYP